MHCMRVCMWYQYVCFERSLKSELEQGEKEKAGERN